MRRLRRGTQGGPSALSFRPSILSGLWLVVGLAFAIGGGAAAYAASGETPEVQGTTFAELNVGDVAVACLPGGECVDEGGALLKAFDPDEFANVQEVSDGDGSALDLGVTVVGTGFGLFEGRTVGGNSDDRFCWTFPPPTGGPASRRPSGKVVCVDVVQDPTCAATSNPTSCGPTSCSSGAIRLRAGRDGDPICTFLAAELAQSVTFGERDLEAVIGFDVDTASQNGSVTLATCAGFKPVCVANPATPVSNASVLNSIPLAVVHTPHLVQMGGKWCDTHTGKCR